MEDEAPKEEMKGTARGRMKTMGAGIIEAWGGDSPKEGAISTQMYRVRAEEDIRLGSRWSLES